MTISGKILEPGIYVQPYMAVIPGTTRQDKQTNLIPHLNEWKSLGVSGVALHDFVGSMDISKFESYGQLVINHGMKVLAAFGLSKPDAARKGDWIAGVSLSPLCHGVLFDAEGSFDADGGKQAAIDMGHAFRAKAPQSLAIDQPWFAPLQHSSFPWKEFAAWIDVHAPQKYCNDFPQFGNQAYEKVFAWSAKEWTQLNQRLVSENLVRPEIITIQGYKWNLSDLINCLTTHPCIIIWTEPYPDQDFMRALKIVKKLKDLGCTGAEAVKNFQTASGLTADNSCGPLTIAKLGI